MTKSVNKTDTFTLPRDSYYIRIEKVNDELFFFPIYIDGKGLRETFKWAGYKFKCKSEDRCNFRLKQRIIPLFHEMVEKGDYVFDYAYTDVNKNILLLLTPHTTLLGVKTSICELLMYLIEKGEDFIVLERIEELTYLKQEIQSMPTT